MEGTVSLKASKDYQAGATQLSAPGVLETTDNMVSATFWIGHTGGIAGLLRKEGSILYVQVWAGISGGATDLLYSNPLLREEVCPYPQPGRGGAKFWASVRACSPRAAFV